MTDYSKRVRGASYPVIDLQKALDYTQKLLEQIGKASATSENIVKAIGYKSLNGKSKRVVAALSQYGLIRGKSSNYQLTELALQILFPTSESAKIEAIKSAARKPVLFNTLLENYNNDRIPGLLSNILVSIHKINPGSGDDAAQVFRNTVQFAQIVDENDFIKADSPNTDLEEEIDLAEENRDVTENSDVNIPVVGQKISVQSSSDSLNKIEIFIREGVKAGIYAPYNLTEAEKTKLKSIIDLL